MKSNFVHVCFVIDRSGSMYGSENDVIGGFNSTINEQKNNENGSCSISLYEFDSSVELKYRGVDVNEISEFIYKPSGNTALYDAIGTAIKETGDWLSEMDEDDRPEKNMIVIMTDGGENSSRHYNLSEIKDMIKHQEDKYNWSFIYLGADLKDADQGNSLNIKNQAYFTKKGLSTVYSAISSIATNFRNKINGAYYDVDSDLREFSESTTNKYCADNNLDIKVYANTKTV